MKTKLNEHERKGGKEMKRTKLGSIIKISKGKKYSIIDNPSSDSKRVIGIEDLRNDDQLKYTDDIKGTSVIPEDILIAWDGANAGTIGHGKEGFIGSTIARLRVEDQKNYFTPFLSYFLQQKFDYLRKTATGATIPHINRNALEKILLPEVAYDDQVRIAELYSGPQVQTILKKIKCKSITQYHTHNTVHCIPDLESCHLKTDVLAGNCICARND